jgi:hypothetical protein
MVSATAKAFAHSGKAVWLMAPAGVGDLDLVIAYLGYDETIGFLMFLRADASVSRTGARTVGKSRAQCPKHRYRQTRVAIISATIAG